MTHNVSLTQSVTFGNTFGSLNRGQMISDSVAFNQVIVESNEGIMKNDSISFEQLIQTQLVSNRTVPDSLGFGHWWIAVQKRGNRVIEVVGV